MTGLVKRTIVVAAVFGVAGGRLDAQTLSSQCAQAAIAFQDACQKTTDVFNYLTPQLAGAVAGGNATPGVVGTVGGLGHFWVGLRGTLLGGTVPQFSNIALHTSGATSDSIPTKSFPVPMVGADGAVGLFPGAPLGFSYVGSIDLLLNAFYLPSFTSNNADVHPDHPLSVGIGGRLGLLTEKGPIPGVAVTYVERSLPTTTITATNSSGDSLQVRDLSLSTYSWRITAGKTLAILGVVGGIGEDTYIAHTKVSAEVDGLSSGSAPLATPHESLTRANYFLDLSLNLSLFRIVGEIGGVSGGRVATYNAFEGRSATAGRTYGSLAWGIKI